MNEAHPHQPAAPTSIIYHAGKTTDFTTQLTDLDLARRLLDSGRAAGRIYGGSGGALVAVAHAVAVSAGRDPDRWAAPATDSLDRLHEFISHATPRSVRRVNIRSPRYGLFTPAPLRRWLTRWLAACGVDDPDSFPLSELAVPTYILACDVDAYPVFFGPPAPDLHAEWHNAATRIEDAPLIDAVIASISTPMVYDSVWVNGAWYKGSRPVYTSLTAIVADMEASAPRPLIHNTPIAEFPGWPSMSVTQPFLMHAWVERNQADLAAHYVDLLNRGRHVRGLLAQLRDQADEAGVTPGPDAAPPTVHHIRLGYIGSTEAGTNIRQSIENRAEWSTEFERLATPQVAAIDPGGPADLIFGAGGFSGVLAETVVAKMLEDRGVEARRVFGCSAGVLSGLFYAVKLAADRCPDLYTPQADDALEDFYRFFDGLSVGAMFRINRTPRTLWRAVGSADPLRRTLLGYIEKWTGRPDPDRVTFESISLPLWVAMTRMDGYLDLAGMNQPAMGFRFAGRLMRPVNCPVIDAVIAGIAQPFYVTPPVIDGMTYFDGGSSYYDIDIFAAGLSTPLPELISIHVGEPIPYTFGFPPRMTLPQLVFDQHNLTFPEGRRRMSALVDLLYAHEADRRRLDAVIDALKAAGLDVPGDLPGSAHEGWWQDWAVADP